MNILAILLTVVIYLPIAAGTQATAASAETGVTVRPNLATGYDPVFGHIIYGEVDNASDGPIALVRVTATRPGGQSADSIVKIGTINPGEHGCFAIYTQSAEPWTDAVMSVSYLPAHAYRHNVTVIDNESSVDDQGNPVVDTTLRNTTGVTMTTIAAVATLYDGSGNVIGCSAVTAQPRTVGIDKTATAYIRFTQRVQRGIGGAVVAFNGVEIRR